MSVTDSSTDRTTSGGTPVREPVMKVNSYDRISSGMISLVLGLIVAVFCVFAWWLTTRPPTQEFLVPMEMVAVSGGSEEGVPDETLNIESPEDPNENASVSEQEEVSDLTESVDQIIELAEQATQQAEQVMTETSETGGTPGSAQGTGRRALGSGPGEGGIPNEQRWFIRYSDESSLMEYARQLDFFGVELGALLSDGRLIYLSKLSSATPAQRVSNSGKDEQRLYMTWQGGSRKDADVKLFARAGLDVSQAILFHFYPKKTEQLLLLKEFQYARRKVQEIRRTYFVVSKQDAVYDFVVIRQTYLK